MTLSTTSHIKTIPLALSQSSFFQKVKEAIRFVSPSDGALVTESKNLFIYNTLQGSPDFASLASAPLGVTRCTGLEAGWLGRGLG